MSEGRGDIRQQGGMGVVAAENMAQVKPFKLILGLGAVGRSTVIQTERHS